MSFFDAFMGFDKSAENHKQNINHTPIYSGPPDEFHPENEHITQPTRPRRLIQRNGSKERRIYITWFLILVLPPILLRLGTASGNIALSEDFAAFLTIVTKVGAIILTIWYGLKVEIRKVWAWVLGFSTLLPLMVWVSAAILLTRKTGSQPASLKISGGRPTLSPNEIFDEDKTNVFVRWFIKNEPFVNAISNRSSNIIFEAGNIPNVPLGYNPSKDKKFNNLSDWFVAKLTQDIKKLKTVSKTEFKDFLDKQGEAGNKTLITVGELAVKYNLNFDEFVYEREIQKIPERKERDLFKKNLLDDNVIGAEQRILGWLYHEWFGDWYKVPEK